MERLKQLRTDAGLTQQDVARLLGVERSTYVKYERGQSDPPTATLIRLADYFGVSVDYVIGRDFSLATAGSNGLPPDLLSDEEQLLVMYRSMNQQGKEYILQTMTMAVQTYKKIDSSANLEEHIG